MSDDDHVGEVEQARALLESVALLETVAAERQKKAEQILGYLSSDGMKSGEMADRLDLSDTSVHRLLNEEDPKAPHERMGVSENSAENLKEGIGEDAASTSDREVSS